MKTLINQITSTKENGIELFEKVINIGFFILGSVIVSTIAASLVYGLAKGIL